MKVLTYLSAISILCISSIVMPAIGEDLDRISPSNSYTPTPAEFSPRFLSAIENITTATQQKDTKRLKAISGELLSLEESNNTRATDDEKYFLSGYARRKAGDLQGAVEDFRTSIEYRQSNPHAHFLLAQTYADLSNCEQALSELDQVRFILGTESAASYILRAVCLSKLNRQSEADTLITAARRAFPTEAQIKRVSLNFKAKAIAQGAILSDAQSAELDGDLEELAQSNPEDSNIQLMYGKSLLKKGDILTRSQELLTAEKVASSLVKKTEYQNEAAIKLLFDVLLKLRRYKDAKETIMEGLTHLPDSQLLADSKRQFEIETNGLRVLKYGRR